MPNTYSVQTCCLLTLFRQTERLRRWGPQDVISGTERAVLPSDPWFQSFPDPEFQSGCLQPMIIHLDKIRVGPEECEGVTSKAV